MSSCSSGIGLVCGLFVFVLGIVHGDFSFHLYMVLLLSDPCVARSKVYFDFIDYYFWCEQKKRSKCLCKVKILSAPILCLAAILKENK